MKTNAHDKLFRGVFGTPEYAADLFRHFLPANVVRQLDLTSLRRVDASFVDELLRERFADLLFEVDVLNGGEPVLVYILLEHQSTVERLMAMRLQCYMDRVWIDYLARHPKAKRIPRVIPIVVFQGPGRWTPSLQFADLFDGEPALRGALAPWTLSFKYIVIELPKEADETLRLLSLGGLALQLLKNYQADDFLEQLPRWFSAMREALVSRTGLRVFSLLVEYLVESTSYHHSELEMALEQVVGPETKDVFMTAAQTWLDEGKKLGIDEGVARGRRQSIARLPELRFGSLTEGTKQRLDRADLETLDRWLDRVLTSTSVNEVFAV